MPLKAISIEEAKRLLADGARLVDVREADEVARERIGLAKSVPLSRLDEALPLTGDQAIIFHCKAGNRTAAHASRLAAATTCDAYVLEGGIEAWKAAGLPVITDKSQPIEIMRQVQITAGSLVLLGVILGTWVHPGFFGLSAFIGAGLTFAGTTGWCGMAKVLALMPWNRPQTSLPLKAG
ncbi:rhodanese family protein [Aquidulcibacter paucihalophilus]|uniref:rhodanese family protein n=1 Tax=Aquidulcibacter paucihalophilus TaxID=1978549 RepID=UPI000A1959F2|nr:rhodanese family protein [Aquidulcibacter paucihalophilus]